MRTLLISLLLCLPCFGAEAKIEGQSSVFPGVQFVLNGNSSVGNHFEWIVDPAIGEMDEKYRPSPFICNGQFALSLVVPGTYYFHYVASDADGISVATHKLVVEESFPGPVPDPPAPGPSLDLEEVSRASAPNDPATKAALAQAIRDTAKQVASADLEAAKEAMEATVKTVLLMRSNRSADWFAWREALNKSYQANPPPTTSAYLSSQESVVRGLEPSSSSVRSISSIYYYVGASCPPCIQWEANEFPKLRTPVHKVFRHSYSTPSFRVNYSDGTSKMFIGYTSASQLER